jgi:hypothetical protein
MIKAPSLFWWGIFTGVIGMLFYANFREPQILFDALPAYQWIKFSTSPIILPRYASEWFPSFLHVVGMSLFTAGLLGTAGKRWLVIPICWLAVDLAFEFGQATETLGVLSYGNFEWMDVTALIVATIFSILWLFQHNQKAIIKPTKSQFAIPLAVVVGSGMMLGSYQSATVDQKARYICTYPDQSEAICAIEPIYLDWESFRGEKQVSFSAENSNALTQAYIDAGSRVEEFIGLENSGKIYLYQHYMFIISELRGVYIFDNTNREAPVYLGFVHVNGASDVLIHQGMLVVAALTDLVLIDFNNLNSISTQELALSYPDYNRLSPQATIFAKFSDSTEEYESVYLDYEIGLVIGYKNADGKSFYFWPLEELL